MNFATLRGVLIFLRSYEEVNLHTQGRSGPFHCSCNCSRAWWNAAGMQPMAAIQAKSGKQGWQAPRYPITISCGCFYCFMTLAALPGFRVIAKVALQWLLACSVACVCYPAAAHWHGDASWCTLQGDVVDQPGDVVYDLYTVSEGVGVDVAADHSQAPVVYVSPLLLLFLTLPKRI